MTRTRAHIVLCRLNILFLLLLQFPQYTSRLSTICPISFPSTVYGKPILPTSSTSPSPVPFLQGGGGVRAGGEDVTDKDGGKVGGGDGSDGQVLHPPSVDNIPRPLSPTKLTPVGRHQRINQ